MVTRGDETLATFGPGDFFGEGAIFRARRRTATVTVAERSTRDYRPSRGRPVVSDS